MPYYINRNGQGQRETVDEFDTLDEANAMLAEYRLSDPSASYRISRKPEPGWAD